MRGHAVKMLYMFYSQYSYSWIHKYQFLGGVVFKKVDICCCFFGNVLSIKHFSPNIVMSRRLLIQTHFSSILLVFLAKLKLLQNFPCTPNSSGWIKRVGWSSKREWLRKKERGGGLNKQERWVKGASRMDWGCKRDRGEESKDVYVFRKQERDASLLFNPSVLNPYPITPPSSPSCFFTPSLWPPQPTPLSSSIHPFCIFTPTHWFTQKNLLRKQDAGGEETGEMGYDARGMGY